MHFKRYPCGFKYYPRSFALEFRWKEANVLPLGGGL